MYSYLICTCIGDPTTLYLKHIIKVILFIKDRSLQSWLSCWLDHIFKTAPKNDHIFPFLGLLINCYLQRTLVFINVCNFIVDNKSTCCKQRSESTN